jgi:hypothetical protein
MNIEFHWSPESNSATQAAVETELREVFQDRLQPCHHGTIITYLGISGPLEIKLTGSVKCQCGKTLATFTGDSEASHLDIFTKNE